MSCIPEDDILKCINQARTNPSGFAKYVQAEINSFIDNQNMPLYQGCNYTTNEGIGAWKEALNFLQNQKPLPAYQLNQGLTLAARDHVTDMEAHPGIGHTGSKGESLMARIQKRCGNTVGAMAECIGNDFNIPNRNHALQTILALVIDDGVSNRGHRVNIFSESYQYIGCCSKIIGKNCTTVIDFHSVNMPTIDNSSGPQGNPQGNQWGNNQPPQGNQWGSNPQGNQWGSNPQGNQWGNNQPPQNNPYGGGNNYQPNEDYQFGSAENNYQPNQNFQFESEGNNYQPNNFQFGSGGNNYQPMPFSQNQSFGSAGSNYQPTNNHSGGKTPVGHSTSSRIQTINGVTKKVTINRITYSDGTTEENVQQS